MSEEKLYAVKNDEGEWMSLYGTQTEIWYSNNPTLFKDKSYAEAQSMGRKAHVVELVEPEKVVLTKEQAEIVENARDEEFPATYISDSADLADFGEEELLMKAYVNGWTVERPQRWYVKTPDNWMGKEKQGWLFKIGGSIRTVSEKDCEHTADEQFTEAEIEHYGLQGFEKEEVTDDEN
ncbi:DUF1642 domain-containing protein [Loigolactobacillus coryniformis subsp. coryniformis]|uniref:DUF1642 domain-containing protein n=1 Tax=Loigolactobacillus coryniformis TaxID=1610 RepID=UPI0039957407